jgi:plasmid stability protein
MAGLTIRNVDETTKQALRVRAAWHGVSMEEEARQILRETLAPPAAPSMLGSRLLARFAVLACEEFEAPVRQSPRPAPQWDDPA